MTSKTIRNLDEEGKTRLGVRATKHDRSMEEQLRRILRDAAGFPESTGNLVSAVGALIEPLGAVDLE